VLGAVVLSLRGGDFLFESGQDLSLGYDHPTPSSVHLYVEESFTCPGREHPKRRSPEAVKT